MNGRSAGQQSFFPITLAASPALQPGQAGGGNLNQVERWFGLITQQAIRRGSFDGVRQLVLQIQRYVVHYSVHKRPFVRTATADSIRANIERLCNVIPWTQH